MEAETDDQFYAIMHKHVHSLYISTLSSFVSFDITLASYYESLKMFAARPGFIASVIAIIVLMLITQTSNYWMHIAARQLPFRLLSQHVIRQTTCSANRRPKPNVRLSTCNAGVFAMQGRRARMEDTFDVLAQMPPGNASEHSFSSPDLTRAGIHLYGIFDGHGGDVSIIILIIKCFIVCDHT